MPAKRYISDENLKDYRAFRKGGRKIFEHRDIAEKTLGRILPPGVEIHHHGLKTDNSKLVICPSRGYHMLLHYRTRALNACGNANYVKCGICKEYGDSETMWTQQRPNGKGFRAHHRACAALKARLKKLRHP